MFRFLFTWSQIVLMFFVRVRGFIRYVLYNGKRESMYPYNIILIFLDTVLNYQSKHLIFKTILEKMSEELPFLWVFNNMYSQCQDFVLVGWNTRYIHIPLGNILLYIWCLINCSACWNYTHCGYGTSAQDACFVMDWTNFLVVYITNHSSLNI